MKTLSSAAWLNCCRRILPTVLLAFPLAGLAQNTTNLTMPVVSIRAIDADATWQGDPGLFMVSRRGPTNATLNLFYTIEGSATNGIDYAAIANWITIPAGVNSNFIRILPKDMGQTEMKTVVLTLNYPPTMPPINFLIGSPSNALVTIRPTRPPQTVVSIQAPDPRAMEPGGTNQGDPGMFTLYRMGPTNFPLPVLLRLAGTAINGSDYAKINDVVVIPEGEVSANVTVEPLGDNLAEGLETVVVQVVPPYCAAIFPPPRECYLVGKPNAAELTIADAQEPPPPTNYPPVVRITSPPNGAVFRGPVHIPIFAFANDREDGISSVEFFAGTNRLGSGEPVPGCTNMTGTVNATNLYVYVWSNAPAGFHVLSALATANNGQTARSAPVSITVMDCPPPPTNRPVLISIIAKDPIAIEGTNSWVWPGLVDPAAGWRQWPTGSCRFFTNCGPKNATFLVRRQGATNEALTVKYRVGGSASNGVDYALLPGEVTIPAGERAALISVVPMDDTIPERCETVILRLKPSEEALASYLVGMPGSAAALILDGDRPGSGGLLPDKSFHLTAAGPDGAWFRVEVSTNMTDWSLITYGQVINGSIDFVDPDTQNIGSRFYRAVPELTVPAE